MSQILNCGRSAGPFAMTPLLLASPGSTYGETAVREFPQSTEAPESATTQVVVDNPVSPVANKELSGFFAIGIAINIVLLAAFLVWAVKQWR